MTSPLGFAVGSHSFRIEGEPERVRFAAESILGSFATAEPQRDASAVLHLVEELGHEGGRALLDVEQKETIGLAERTDDGLRVACFEPLAVGRAVGLVMGTIFKPPRFAMVHGAGLAHGGRAVLALGESGAGKSTLSTLVEEASLLSDEVVVIEEAGARVLVHGTPLRSSSPRLPEPMKAELVSFLSLVKSTDVSLHAQSRASAVRLLLEQMFVDEMDPQAESYLDTATRLAGRVPANALHFRKDRACAPLVMNLLA